MGKIKHIQYIHLPYVILKDNSLIHNEKLVLSNIISVITGGGQYRFDNSFIADYLNCSTRTASRVVSLLVSKNIIKSEFKYKPDSKEIQHRVLSLTSGGMDTYVVTPTSPMSGGGIDTDGVVILKPSNTINNTNKDISKDISKFDEWWNLYNKKTGKEKALKKWTKLPGSIYETIIDHSSRYVTAVPEKQFRKDPITYLNNFTWEDEYMPGSDGGDSEEKWNTLIKSATGDK